MPWRPAPASRTGGTPTTRRGSGSCLDGDPADVRWFDAPACYVFHTLNAYDDVHDADGHDADAGRAAAIDRWWSTWCATHACSPP